MGRLVNVLTSVGTDTAEAAVADVAGVVQASNHVSEFTGALAETVVDYLAGLARRLADVQARINELANQYGDHTGLPGGTWPQAVNA